jgi:hypothetical protein
VPENIKTIVILRRNIIKFCQRVLEMDPPAPSRLTRPIKRFLQLQGVSGRDLHTFRRLDPDFLVDGGIQISCEKIKAMDWPFISRGNS